MEHPYAVLAAPTPLHYAAEVGDAAAVAILIKNGQDPNSKARWLDYEDGATPLHLAAQRGNTEVVRALLDACAEPRGCEAVSPYWDADLTPLHEASARGHVEVVRALLSAGGEPDCIACGTKVGKLRVERCGHQVLSGWDGGHTPLHLASAFGYADVVRALVESGASVGARGGANDETPLHFAALCGQVDAMAALIESGANIDVGDNSGNTALHVAADVSSTEFLLAAGANPNLVAESPYGSCTPLGSYCTLIHRLETAPEGVENATSQVKALLRHGADTRLRARRDFNGKKSPILSCAAKNGVPGIVLALLEAGLNPNERDQEGWAPLHDAVRGDHVEVVRLLLRAGADIDVRTLGEGCTPLHIACRFTSVDCVLELLKSGCDLNATDDYPYDDDWLSSRPSGGRRKGASRGPGKTPAEVIGLRHRAAAPLVKGRSADPCQDEDEQMEVFHGENRKSIDPSVRHPHKPNRVQASAPKFGSDCRSKPFCFDPFVSILILRCVANKTMPFPASPSLCSRRRSSARTTRLIEAQADRLQLLMAPRLMLLPPPPPFCPPSCARRAEDTGCSDTGAPARNAIRRALRREASWRGRRGVILLKAYFDRQSFATSLPRVVNAITGAGDPEPASSAASDGERGWNVPTRRLKRDAARVKYGGAKRRRRSGAGVAKDETASLGLLKGVLDLACCEELFRQVVMFL